MTRDYLKHFNKRYELGECDCWTLIQDIFKDEYNMELPNCPFAVKENEKNFAEYLKANLILEELEKPKKSCVIHKSGINEHIGYCINDRKYIHRTVYGTKIGPIPIMYCKYYLINGVK